MNILLVEPDYKNKYPPMGLMKISTYHKMKGDSVTFFKGVMKRGEFDKGSFERIYITSLFTFHFKKTIDTIKCYQRMISSEDIFVGGIMASLMTQRVRDEIGSDITILTGLLTDSGVLRFNDKVNIDILPLDYSILDEIEYEYPAGKENFFAYVSRGCTNKCKFCAVPILEPKFCMTNNITTQIETIRDSYGDKQNLLLLDNNILSFNKVELDKVVQDIRRLGFDGETKYYPELPIKMYISKLDRLSKESEGFQRILDETTDYIYANASRKKSAVYTEKYSEIVSELQFSSDKFSTIKRYEAELVEILSHYYRPRGRKRHVDFNQGIDARQLTAEKMSILAKIPIEPFRLAFDNIKYSEIYSKAIRLAANYGVTNFSNYILFNFNDTPEELWQRLKINIDLSKELNVRIFSFPMKFAPIDKIDRKHIGKHWNHQYLSNVAAILNVTKGIVADGEDFFYRAFGRDPGEFMKLLMMPRDFVIYRKEYELNGLSLRWRNVFDSLSAKEHKELIDVLSCKKTAVSSGVIDIYSYYTKSKTKEGKETYESTILRKSKDLRSKLG